MGEGGGGGVGKKKHELAAGKRIVFQNYYFKYILLLSFSHMKNCYYSEIFYRAQTADLYITNLTMHSESITHLF